jgi:nitrate reductase NapE component
MSKFKPHEKQHWLFGLAACLWPVAFALVGLFGSVPVQIASMVVRYMR